MTKFTSGANRTSKEVNPLKVSLCEENWDRDQSKWQKSLLKMEIIQGLLWFKLICAGLLLQLFLQRLHITAQRDATGRAQGDVLCVLQNDLTEINHVWSKMKTGTYTICAPGCPKCTYMILHVLILPAANGNKKHENITGANISPLYSMTSTYHESEEGVSDRDFKDIFSNSNK